MNDEREPNPSGEPEEDEDADGESSRSALCFAAGLDNHAGSVRSYNVGQGNFHAGGAFAHPDIDVIERRRFELDDDIALRRDLGIGRVFVAKLVAAAMGVNADGFQSVRIYSGTSEGFHHEGHEDHEEKK